MTYLKDFPGSGKGDNLKMEEERVYRYRIHIRDNFDPLALSMLEKNDLKYFIRPACQWMEDEVLLRFNLSPSFESLAGGREWEDHAFFNFLKDLVAVGKEAEDYLLFKEEISWSDELIYLSPTGPALIYLPVHLNEGKPALDRFLKKIIVEGRFSREEAEFLPPLIAAMGSGDFDLNRLEAFLGTRSTEKNGSRDHGLPPAEKEKESKLSEKKTHKKIKGEESLPSRPLFADYPKAQDYILEEEKKREKDHAKDEPPAFFQGGDEDEPAPPKESIEGMSLYYLLTHFSIKNWRVYRKQKSGEEKVSASPGKARQGGTQLLKGSGAYLWWDKKKRAIPLDKFPFLLGSGDKAAFQVKSPYVSRNHAQIIHEKGEYFLVDNGSSNGSFLEGKKLKAGVKVKLADQAHISLAKENFLFFSS